MLSHVSLQSIEIRNKSYVCELVNLVGTDCLNADDLNSILVVLFVSCKARDTCACESNLGC